MKIKINNKIFNHFTSFSIDLIYNAIASTFSFSGLNKFVPDPLSFYECEIYDDDNQLLITGTIMGQTQTSSSKPELFNISGYSKTGILEDCNLPIDLYPLQTDNLNLKEVVDKIFPYFNIKYETTSNIFFDFTAKYDKLSLMPTQTIKDYINKLCSQKNIILTHIPNGKILFTRLNLKDLKHSKTYNEGVFGYIDAKMIINGQSMFRYTTVMRQASENPDSGQYTIENPYVNINRNKTRILSNGNLFDVSKAARTDLSNQLRSIQFIITSTKFIAPGKLIRFKSKDFGIKKYIDLFVEKTNIKGTSQGIVYQFNCVLKDVYTDETNITNIFK